jgi:hypothetical protein
MHRGVILTKLCKLHILMCFIESVPQLRPVPVGAHVRGTSFCPPEAGGRRSRHGIQVPDIVFDLL